MLSQLSKSLSRQGLAIDFHGTRRPYKYSLELRPDFKITDTRIEIRIGIRLRIQSRLKLLVSSLRPPSPLHLPNSNLKTPLTIPSEAGPKC
ncbi:hypothetical protein AVEN_49892-1 [Araneus ventricosus]|uniref:Uncharacterized protein n=1 Tax=Araneus ventricosus TaxID=182803 RepID=A0A4Y2SWD7_ARAVE|nr:hypothetical protein AVEN_49892-1 [Araneus ventricosus]